MIVQSLRKSKVTLIELGRQLNLTPRAVSQALHGGESSVKVSEATRQRAVALAEKLGYRPNRMARTLRTGKSNCIAILLQHSILGMSHEMLFLAQKEISKRGFSTLIATCVATDLASLDELVTRMLEDRVAGVLILGGFSQGVSFARLHGEGTPVVVAGGKVPHALATFVSDERGAFANLVAHLVGIGCTRLLAAGIHSSVIHSNAHVAAAVEGIQQGIETANGSGRGASVEYFHDKVEFDGFWHPDFPQIHGLFAAGYSGMLKVLERGPLPDALICTNDAWAFGAIRACKERGVALPESLAITGFDDSSFASGGLLPITTVRQPLEEMVVQAVDHLLQSTKSGNRDTQPETFLPCELIIRESSLGWKAKQSAVLG